MSIKTMTKIWDRLNVSGGDLLLALSIGDFSNDQGESIWPTVDTMCRMTRQSRATVQRQLAMFRDVDWLQVVDDGGLAGGRGKSTLYRINADWIRGASLPKLPDILPDQREKGLNLRPFPSPAPAPKGPQSEAVSGEKGPHPEQERASNTTGKGLTAVRQDPSGSINKPLSDGPRASPTGSQAAQEREQQRPDYDIAARINHWRRRAGEWVIRECSCLEIVKGRPTQWKELPDDLRHAMLPKMERIVTEIAEFERSEPKVKLDTIEAKLQSRLTFELKEFTPSSVAETASDNAALAR